jgi:hypothetical protein
VRLTQEQISELMVKVANSENGTNLLLQMTLKAFIKSESHLHKKENPDAYKWLKRIKSTLFWQGNCFKSSYNYR